MYFVEKLYVYYSKLTTKRLYQVDIDKYLLYCKLNDRKYTCNKQGNLYSILINFVTSLNIITILFSKKSMILLLTSLKWLL